MTMASGQIKTARMDWESWDSETLATEMKLAGLAEFADKFKEANIIGSVLPRVNVETLKSLGIMKVGDQLRIQKFIEEVTQPNTVNHCKVFNDPIHGHIELHPLCVKIIDTAQFQRLRFIKQLGLCYFVYPGASHNRFEHSLGVCYLAGQLVRALKSRQPELKITDIDVLCVEIAGLCHDLGHGPFSHMFDKMFIPHFRSPDKKWEHEHLSTQMLGHLIEENRLLPEFEKYSLSASDIKFIKEQVTGLAPDQQSDWADKGRPIEKAFLYEIVSNKRNGIDVDKWDYFARDCHMLGIQSNFDHKRFVKFARVIKKEGRLQICSRDKEVWNLYDMFYTRSALHRRAYQHKVTKIIETMVTDAMIKANDYILFPTKDKEMKKMSEAIDDMYVFSQLTDFVFFQILYSTEPKLAEARTILQNVLSRKLYECVGQTQLKSSPVAMEVHQLKDELIGCIDEKVLKDLGLKSDDIDVHQLKDELIGCIDEKVLKDSGLKSDDIDVYVVTLDYGMKDKNPIDKVWFYTKNQPNKAIHLGKDQVSQMLPEIFSEKYLRLICKKLDKGTLEMLKTAFQRFCEKNGFPVPTDGHSLE